MLKPALGVLAVALAVAGCGGGRLSQAEFVSKANGICSDINEGLEGIREPSSVTDLAEVLDEGLVIVNDGLVELRDLKPPEALDARYDAWLDKVDESAEALAKASAAAKRNDQASVGLALQEGDDANTAANRLAAELGLTTCAVD